MRTTPQVGDVRERGFRRCLICGKPHEDVITELYPEGSQRAGQVMRTTWAASDGHPYHQETWETYAARLQEAIAEVRREKGERMTPQELLIAIEQAVKEGTIQFEPLAPAETIGDSTQGPFDLIPATCSAAEFYEGSSVIEIDGRRVVNLALILRPS